MNEPCATVNKAKEKAYLVLQVFHGLLMGLGHSALMVTQHSHGTVSTVVRQDLGGHAIISCTARKQYHGY
jgi:hypothetical protein